MNGQRTSFAQAALVTIRRECLSHRVNRFLYGHLGLLAAAGVIAVFAAPADEERGVAWFVLHSVLYVVSLSAVLLGLSSAQAERDEVPFLLTQPTGIGPWVTGKAIGLGLIVMPSAALLVVPWLVTSGWSHLLLLLAVSTAGLCVVLSMVGLAIGLWIQEPVRALISAVAVWFFLLFATDLLLILVAGSPWIHAHPSAWVAPLMANPFDAFRISMLFTLERAAFNTLGSGALVAWWTTHAGIWLACCTAAWAGCAYLSALCAARRHRRG